MYNLSELALMFKDYEIRPCKKTEKALETEIKYVLKFVSGESLADVLITIYGVRNTGIIKKYL